MAWFVVWIPSISSRLVIMYLIFIIALRKSKSFTTSIGDGKLHLAGNAAGDVLVRKKVELSGHRCTRQAVCFGADHTELLSDYKKVAVPCK